MDPIRRPDPPPPGRVRMAMTVAYNGAPFCGFARNQGVPTVAGALSDGLGRVLGHEVDLACAGRTDRGVHAAGQVVSFDAASERADPARLVRSVNRICGPDVAARNALVVADDFDARLSCLSRVYRYRILNSPVPDPLRAAMSWHLEHPLDLRAMRAASDRLLGARDFSSFCRRNRSRPDESLVRTVHRAEWQRQDDLLVFEIEARSFCHQMVRSLVGTLAAVGSGRLQAAAVDAILEARNRNAAPSPAPPQGLILQKARYRDY